MLVSSKCDSALEVTLGKGLARTRLSKFALIRLAMSLRLNALAEFIGNE